VADTIRCFLPSNPYPLLPSKQLTNLFIMIDFHPHVPYSLCTDRLTHHHNDRFGRVPQANDFLACFSPQSCPLRCRLIIVKNPPWLHPKSTSMRTFLFPSDHHRIHPLPLLLRCRVIIKHPPLLPFEPLCPCHLSPLIYCLGSRSDSVCF
jgi:hypothetical protein